MTDEERLKEIAADYIADKAEEAKIKKRLESNNASLKQLMETLKCDYVELDDGSKVVYSITKRESIDEEKLIDTLQKFAPNTKCIKTKEYVDMDVLESELYHNTLPEKAVSAMDDCRVIKETPTLTIRKARKGK